jgi:hypothetical protein
MDKIITQRLINHSYNKDKRNNNKPVENKPPIKSKINQEKLLSYDLMFDIIS